jgi:MFS family permease
MMTFTKLAQRFGRKPIFAIFFVLAFLSTAITFKFLSETWHIFTLIPLMGFCQLGLFAGFAIYLPELFPTRLRSTGAGFCYNAGRLIAAAGPFVVGAVGQKSLDTALDVLACVAIAPIVGLLLLPFAIETKGHVLQD